MYLDSVRPSVATMSRQSTDDKLDRQSMRNTTSSVTSISRDLINKVNKSVESVKEKVKQTKVSMGLNSVQRRRAFFVSAAEERELMARKYPVHSWPIRLLSFLQSSNVQLVMTAMLIVDVLIVVVELFLDAEFPPCTIIERDAVSCCTANTSSNGIHAGSSNNLCAMPLVDTPYFKAACDPYKHLLINNLKFVLFLVSVTLLSVFLLELFCLMGILRQHFFRNRLYVIDVIIVTAALSLEFVVKLVVRSGSSGDLAGILTFARCWRFVRLGHGESVAT